MSYGATIQEWRKKAGLTQHELASRIACTDGYISHIESEVKIPSLEVCMALAKVLSRSPAEEEQLIEVVERARRERTEKRIRTRGAVIHGALRTRGGVAKLSAPPSEAEVHVEEIARLITDDPDLQAILDDLKRILADAHIRGTFVNTVRVFAKAAKRDSVGD